ncbi:PIN domain-containing protein [Gordonia sp. JH63]|uniref:Type II toxin-antitoxin system VapC family toxin n=1 Tax=Gordonia hongkongensis TaxID=1701090 RepID=A0AAX3T6H6_9ACTN|nr:MULTISPECIES: type II toxin-antitoxin system VapC family toxin [Gordonia]MCZ4537420.1 type II toxin-antitoxin system VapC family toxin [Gordonia terrae]OCW84733.1 twitching motility protein PilT [Nocardia farcinica]MBN0974604.1 type II toxin-antitoxin system VapC family toxin [Gordonia sp. BP-119]MBN0984354.1 type II toxin-antitoxin system VapC family toxin [Gordonia sp. BP-94]MCT1352804.1 type II toxin-antitoxin system VapC family toxin [Gordonia sp. p3-SID1431]
MTDVLLDTNAVLWLVSEPDRLSPTTLDILANPGNALYVSAASAWEIAIKTRLGRLDGAPLLAAWEETLSSMSATDLAIDSSDAVTAGQLAWEHRDPFDRMIVAQATRRGLTIATSDQVIQTGTLTPVIDTRR